VHQTQWLEDPGLQHVLDRLTGDLLDDQAEQDIVDVGIEVALARQEIGLMCD
jgi:hypothetical protein